MAVRSARSRTSTPPGAVSLPEPDVRGSVTARRQRFFLAIACTAAVLSTGGLVASTWIKSPAEVRAEAAPPRASVLTAPVESRRLTRTVVFRGRFTPARSLTFGPSSVLSPDGRSGSGRDLLLTKAPRKAGGPVPNGSVVAEVSYRPVFALRGKIPAIRDLVQGDSGPDVAQLQAALAAVGIGCGADRKGAFGAGTAGAVQRFYRRIGYRTPMAMGGLPPESEEGEQGEGGGEPPGRNEGGRETGRRVMLPKSEVMFVPSFPARVSKLNARIGGKVTERLVSVTVGDLRLVGRLDDSGDGLAKAGQEVEVFVEDIGKTYPAHVGSVGEAVSPRSGDEGGKAPHTPVVIEAHRPWSASLDGLDARITITAAATDGEVLAVPVSAIVSAADGKASVTVLTREGGRRRVPVVAGMSSDGLVEVRPAEGTLRVGDEVVVGR